MVNGQEPTVLVTTPAYLATLYLTVITLCTVLQACSGKANYLTVRMVCNSQVLIETNLASGSANENTKRYIGNLIANLRDYFLYARC